MSDSRSTVAFALLLCLAGPPAGAAQDRMVPNGIARLSELSSAFQSLSGFVSPAVVQVVTTGYGVAEGADSGTVNLQRGGGSGVIVDASEYIVTSGHVVEGARQVQRQGRLMFVTVELP